MMLDTDFRGRHFFRAVQSFGGVDSEASALANTAPFRRSGDNGSSSGARVSGWISWRRHAPIPRFWVSVSWSSGKRCVWWTCSPPFAACHLFLCSSMVVLSSLGVMSKSDHHVSRCCLENCGARPQDLRYSFGEHTLSTSFGAYSTPVMVLALTLSAHLVVLAYGRADEQGI